VAQQYGDDALRAVIRLAAKPSTVDPVFRTDSAFREVLGKRLDAVWSIWQQDFETNCSPFEG